MHSQRKLGVNNERRGIDMRKILADKFLGKCTIVIVPHWKHEGTFALYGITKEVTNSHLVLQSYNKNKINQIPLEDILQIAIDKHPRRR